jgi:hypothetical protein
LCIARRESAAYCPPPACPPTECPPAASSPMVDPGQTAVESSQDASCPDPADCPVPRRRLFPCCTHLTAWFAHQRHGVPSQQHPDYYSPPAKFHPIPTRPAFEPLPSYPPLLPADSGMNNPLRASTDRATSPSVR